MQWSLGVRKALSSMAYRRQGLPSLRRTNGQCCVFEFEAGEAGEAGPVSSAKDLNLAYLGPDSALLKTEIMTYRH